jgi:hypothetical protein
VTQDTQHPGPDNVQGPDLQGPGQDATVTPDTPTPPDGAPPPPDGAPADGGADGVSGDGPPVNCTPLDLTGAMSIPLENGTITPNGQGGTLASSTWDLSEIKVDTGIGIQVMGTAQGKVEIVAADATTGAARIAVHGDVTMPVTTTFDQTGAGDYMTSANMLNIMGGCGQMSPIMNAQYTATSTTLVIWANVTVMGIPVMLELHLVPAA